jgi:predicted GTPase
MVTCMFCNFIPILGISKESLNSLIDEQEIKKTYGGEIHLGFALLMEKILPKTQSLIEELKPHKICLTGHSLGGALATLAAYRLKRQNFPISCVYTFGAPRVGDSAFASRYEDCKIPHFRIENKNDIVPHLPPDYQTKSKIEFTTQFSNTTLSWLHKFGFSIPDELRNLQIPNIDYPPVGILKFIDWDEKIVEYSDSLRQERLFRLPKNFLKIINSQILLDHDIKSYSQELNHCKIEQKKEIFMQSSEFEKFVFNIVIIGKTGAGKSSLINYLYGYGSPIAKAGVGKPVTERGFHKHNLTWKTIPVNIYDSSGLEVGDAPNWHEMLKDELKEHGTDRPVSEWFHTIFYCLNAATTRVESFEVNIINELITNKYRVIVVLTRADITSKETRSTLKDCIRKEVSSEIPIIEVCSVAQKMPFGETVTSGIDELQEETLRGFWNAITVRLPERCEYVLHKEVDEWYEKQAKYLDSINDNMYRINKLKTKTIITDSFQDFLKELKKTRHEIIVKEVNKIVNYYKQLAAMLKYPELEDLPIFTSENKKIISSIFIEQIAVVLERDQKIYIKIVGKLLHAFLPDDRPSLRSQIAKSCEEFKNEISNQTPEISKIIEKIRTNTP